MLSASACYGSRKSRRMESACPEEYIKRSSPIASSVKRKLRVTLVDRRKMFSAERHISRVSTHLRDQSLAWHQIVPHVMHAHTRLESAFSAANACVSVERQYHPSAHISRGYTLAAERLRRCTSYLL
jgi:hypothetical protein